MIEGIDDLDMGSWEQELQETQERNNLLVVDGLNLAYRYMPRGASLGKPLNFAADLLKTVNSLATSYDCREIIFLNDYKSSNYRLGIHPKYKSDRKIKAKEKTQEEKDAGAAFFEYYNEVAIPFLQQALSFVQCENVEADDLVCYFVEAFEDGEHFDHIWMISSDGDWDELLSERCSRFSTAGRKEYTIENFYDLKGCDTPEQFTNVKAIMGDMGDSVYGVPGIGLKRAYNLVRTYGDVFNVVDSMPIAGKQMFIAALNESPELLMLNLQLVDLRNFYLEAIACGGDEHLPYLEGIVEEMKNA